jgi:multiple sugar transport system substrate-binding protein
MVFISKSKTIKPENYFTGIWQTNEVTGKIYGIPWYIDTRLIYYRKDIFKKLVTKNRQKTGKNCLISHERL